LHSRGRNAIMFDVRRNVLMIGEGTLKRWIVWMRLRIVLIKLVLTLPNSTSIFVNYSRHAIIK